MSEPEDRRSASEPPALPPRAPSPVISTSRYGRYAVLLAIAIVVAITVNTILTRPDGLAGLSPGTKLPPFATPLAGGKREGAANVATHAHEGYAGEVPACSLHESGVLNICDLYEQGPLVLALFVDGSSCTRVLGEMQELLAEFPSVRFAAVAIKGEHAQVRALVRKLHLSFPVGYDEEGTLASLYKVATCPQVTFVRRGGVVASKALLSTPSTQQLRSRVAALQAASAS